MNRGGMMTRRDEISMRTRNAYPPNGYNNNFVGGYDGYRSQMNSGSRGFGPYSGNYGGSYDSYQQYGTGIGRDDGYFGSSGSGYNDYSRGSYNTGFGGMY
jgi:hypothetical protein